MDLGKRLGRSSVRRVVTTKEVTKALRSIKPQERVVNMKQFQQAQQQILNGSREEVEKDNAEEFGSMRVAETFADYVPSKFKMRRKHPDLVVKTTSLVSVDPPDVEFNLFPHNASHSGGCPKDVNFGHWSYPLDVSWRA